MKQTFIFHLDKDGVTASKMKTLYRAVERNYSHKVTWSGDIDGPTRIEIYIQPREMDTIARFIGISKVALNSALQRETGVVRDTALRLPQVPPHTPTILDERIAERVEELRKAGCDVRVEIVSGGYRVYLFGQNESTTLQMPYNAVMTFLRGVERGFVTAPLWNRPLTAALKTLRKPMAKITRRSKRSC